MTAVVFLTHYCVNLNIICCTWKTGVQIPVKIIRAWKGLLFVTMYSRWIGWMSGLLKLFSQEQRNFRAVLAWLLFVKSNERVLARASFEAQVWALVWLCVWLKPGSVGQAAGFNKALPNMSCCFPLLIVWFQMEDKAENQIKKNLQWTMIMNSSLIQEWNGPSVV